jgi:membrane-associated phospholipid phosphatase
VAGSRSVRSTANALSNLALYMSIVHVVVDSVGVAMLAEQNTQVGFEMLSMDAEAYAVTLLLNGITKRVAGRTRPYTEGCATNPNYAAGCGKPDQYASFYSGHAAISATSAGLICAQHTQLSLYGGAADMAACADAIVLTSLTGALRVISDNHWASDVVVGHLIGFASGYFVPTLLHFHSAPAAASSAVRVRVLPQVGDQLGLVAVGSF